MPAATHYVFRIIFDEAEAGGNFLLAIIRREFLAEERRPNFVLYTGEESMPSTRHMIRQLCLRGEPVFLQFNDYEIQNVTTVFPDLMNFDV